MRSQSVSRRKPGRVRIVTDSSAQLSPDLVRALEITVVPLEVEWGGRRLREGLDLSAEEFALRFAQNTTTTIVHPPSIAAFQEVYKQLSQTTSQILSLHLAGSLSKTLEHARAAADHFLGRCRIVVMDSQAASLGLGILVEAAARAALRGTPLDELISLMRGLIPHIYLAFITEHLEYLERWGRIGPSQAILGTMLGIKPFLTLEEGDLIPLEKAQSKLQGVEKLIEFVAEFSEVEQLVILQTGPGPTRESKTLRTRLRDLFPRQPIPTRMVAPSLAVHLGPDSLGVLVYEPASTSL